jgi:hypothetical protein
VQRETEQSKTVSFLDYGVTEAPPGFQAGWPFVVMLKGLPAPALVGHMPLK